MATNLLLDLEPITSLWPAIFSSAREGGCLGEVITKPRQVLTFYRALISHSYLSPEQVGEGVITSPGIILTVVLLNNKYELVSCHL